MKANEFKMSERQLGAVLAGLMVCIAVGFLFLLFKSPTAVIADVRVTDIAARGDVQADKQGFRAGGSQYQCVAVN